MEGGEKEILLAISVESKILFRFKNRNSKNQKHAQNEKLISK
jgi:hypothetical protein